MSVFYLVRVYMSYDEIAESIKEIDEKTKEIKLKFDKETRQRISYIREKRRREAYEHTIKFFDLHFTDEKGLEKIKEIIKIADKEMKEVNPELYASLTVIPLSLDEIKKRGELYEAIYYSICLQMAEAIYNHVKKLKSEIPSKRSKKNLIKLLQKFKELNVIGDKRIDKKIEEIKNLVNKTTEEIKEQIIEDIEKLRKEIQEMIVI